MNWSPEYAAYMAQKYQAKARGIEFLFTFDEWVQWWIDRLGSDWMKKRGRKRGQYVMARLKDKGPYRIGNVKCILATDNMRETAINGTSSAGEKHGCARLTEKEAIAVRKAYGSLNELASKFGVHKSTIQYIKGGQLWSHLTEPVVDYVRERDAKRKLTAEDAIAIFQAVGTRKEIAARYGVTDTNVACIRKGISWGHVTAGLKPREGQQDFRVKLSDDQVREIYVDPRGRHEIAAEYGIAPVTVWEIKHKKKRLKALASLTTDEGGGE